MENKDKEIEYQRYNQKSSEEISIAAKIIQKSGAEAIPYAIRSPYLRYEELIKLNIKPGVTKLLDICCGNGIHSLTAAKAGAIITATDIAENSIEIAKIRAENENLKIEFLVSDAEKLSFRDEEFDVITCAGSLSYLDMEIFIPLVKRMLKTGGKFIIVDSFNHNIVYRSNRFIHYLRGKRSLSTLKRMPTVNTIKYISSHFSSLETEYFGIFSFLTPILSKFNSPEKTKSIIDSLDNRFKFLNKFSFKIVIIATK
jgi:ubiquinone/menaquinone biosynthesis C-methylase UbiE